MKEKIQLFQQKWYTFWATENAISRGDTLHFTLRILLMVVLFTGLNFTFIIFTKFLPLSIYHEPSILLAFFQQSFTTFRIVFLIPFVLLLIGFRVRLWTKWTVFSHFKALRFLVITASFLLAWTYSTYDFNLYFNQSHLSDRLLLLLFIPLIWWRPIFTLLFLPFVHIMIHQFTAISGFTWSIPYMPIHVLMSFAAYFLFYILTKTHHIKDVFFIISCIFIAQYWHSGSMKLLSGWLLNEHIYNLLPATYPNGWLSFMPVEFIEHSTAILAIINTPLKIIVVVVEFGCIFFLLNHKLARLFLLGFICFHIGVFLTSGICFWVWTLMDIAFLILLFRKEGFSNLFVFNKWQILFSFLLIISNKYWGNAPSLYWHSVPMTYTYIIEAEAVDGQTYRLPPNFFAPFDYQFTLTSFSYLNPNTILPITWGASNADLSKTLQATSSVEEIIATEKTKGRVYFNKIASERFSLFIKNYIKHWNSRLTKITPLSIIQSPRHLWTFPKMPFSEVPQNIKKVSIFELGTTYQNGKYVEFRKRFIQTILINNN